MLVIGFLDNLFYDITQIFSHMSILIKVTNKQQSQQKPDHLSCSIVHEFPPFSFKQIILLKNLHNEIAFVFTAKIFNKVNFVGEKLLTNIRAIKGSKICQIRVYISDGPIQLSILAKGK